MDPKLEIQFKIQSSALYKTNNVTLLKLVDRFLFYFIQDILYFKGYLMSCLEGITVVWWSSHGLGDREVRGSNHGSAKTFFQWNGTKISARKITNTCDRSARMSTKMDPFVDIYNNAPSQMVGLSTLVGDQVTWVDFKEGMRKEVRWAYSITIVKILYTVCEKWI